MHEYAPLPAPTDLFSRASQVGSLREGKASVYTDVVYTPIVIRDLEGFDWDAGNVGHILRHEVTPFEVEEVTRQPYVMLPAKTAQGESRWKLFGTTASNRYLVVVFTIRGRLFRTVTAYDMNSAERKKYAAQID